MFAQVGAIHESPARCDLIFVGRASPASLFCPLTRLRRELPQRGSLIGKGATYPKPLSEGELFVEYKQKQGSPFPGEGASAP